MPPEVTITGQDDIEVAEEDLVAEGTMSPDELAEALVEAVAEGPIPAEELAAADMIAEGSPIAGDEGRPLMPDAAQLAPPPAALNLDAVEFRDAVREAEEEVAEAEADYLRKAEHAKAAKKVWEAAVEAMRKVIREHKPGKYPLLEAVAKMPKAEADPAIVVEFVDPAPAPVADDESWREVPLVELGLSPKILLSLADHVHDGRPLATIGALADFTSQPFARLTDVKGIGQAAAEKIGDALAEFWARRGRLDPQTDAELGELLAGADRHAAAVGEAHESLITLGCTEAEARAAISKATFTGRRFESADELIAEIRDQAADDAEDARRKADPDDDWRSIPLATTLHKEPGILRKLVLANIQELGVLADQLSRVPIEDVTFDLDDDGKLSTEELDRLSAILADVRTRFPGMASAITAEMLGFVEDAAAPAPKPRAKPRKSKAPTDLVAAP
jgi:hypothetical protein